MLRIEVSTIVKQERRKVYELLKKIEDYPTFMGNVRTIEVHKESEIKMITSWNIEIDDAEIIWKEEDNFDDSNTTINFNMLEGDFKEYKGKWIVTECGKGRSKIYLIADFNWGLPVFERLVGKVLERKARKSLKSMLLAIKKQAEKD